jgi:hypothetical protein
MVPVRAQSEGETFNVKVLEPFEALAVRVACCALETAATAAVKLALDDPAGASTLPGTLTLELFEETITLNPGDGAGPLKEIVHVEDAGPVTVFGKQESPATLVTCVIEIVPPVSMTGVEVPLPSMALADSSCIGALVSGALGAMLSATFTSGPAGIGVVFIP